VRLIIYLDDILIMAESREKLMSHRDSTLYLLQKLGYVINWKTSILNPTQEIEYLGFQINSKDMLFFLPKTKIDQIKLNCQNIFSKGRVSVREIAKLTGKLISSIQAIFPANLQCRFLQMSQIKGLLVGNSYEQKIILSKEAREELNWWINQIDNHNGKTIISPSPDLVLTSDASNLGWGTTCQGQNTGGVWSKEESALHINAKELLAAFLAIQTFVKQQLQFTIHIKIDNMSAVAYINKMGGGHKVKRLESHNEKNLGLVPGQKNSTNRRISVRKSKFSRRLALQKQTIQAIGV